MALTRMRSRDEGSADRSIRSLRKLQRTGSSCRVLNLLAVSERLEATRGKSETPFFSSPVLNRSLILKHRLRPDEDFLFDDSRINATKIIIPFERRDLGLGAQSVFVGQRGWVEQLRVTCNSPGFSNDIALLEVVDELPSLDPFLLREYLRSRGHWPGPSYFTLAQADIEQMQAFVGSEIVGLIQLAFEKGAEMGGQTARLVSAILASELDERLDPLRLTLMLDGEAFREGVFSWKGFLYYKWMMHNLWPQLSAVITEVGSLSISGPRDPDLADYVARAKMRLRRAIHLQRQKVVDALKVYDDAFKDLTINGRPQAFRDFLLKAPSMFTGLGENVGVVSHIASYWRYRFPAGRKLSAPLEEAANILREFEISLGVTG